MSDGRRFYEAPAAGALRSAPAALRNREPIAKVLGEWLPARGLVLELASGTGEHAVHFARVLSGARMAAERRKHRRPAIDCRARRRRPVCQTFGPPITLDASSAIWPIERADAVLSINMVHISPWSAALGLLDGAARILERDAPLILYGPWLKDDVPTAPSNLDFDASLKSRDPEWGLRRVEDFAEAAAGKGFRLKDTRAMPANNLMLLLSR